jgi:two-component system sensor histidine kinase HydH
MNASKSAQSKFFAMLAAIVLSIGLGGVDYITGREWAISPLYLLPTCLAAWVVGRRAGYAIGALCTAAWVVSDVLNGATYIHPLIPVWNGAMLFVFFLVVVWLLTQFQHSHQHLEQMVDARTAALRAEIEERKRLEQAKLQSERLAVVGSMAARVAHEIRNPLGAISLNLDSISEELKVAVSTGHFSGECQTLLREMRAQIRRIHQVLQDYLRFGRMPSAQRADLSLNELLQEKLKFVQPLLDEKGVELRLAFDPDLGLVHGDAEQLWEAFLNLIRNAIDAMNTEGELTVSTKWSGPDAVVSIIDAGRGMSEDEAARLFKPFFTTKSNGTGLGLAHTQQVVTEHGGKNSMQNRARKGQHVHGAIADDRARESNTGRNFRRHGTQILPSPDAIKQ